MNKAARHILAALFIYVLAAPNLALAATSKVPEFNPLCWKEEACNKIRAQNANVDFKDVGQLPSGWVPDQTECPGQEWGKCLPGGMSETQISFGGQRRFLHLGDFIQKMYRYAIGVAGILAAVMIIVAGFQWVTSGGNSEAISSAKKRIGGALVGVLIAYLSYAILNTLNPALVSLRLPQVWLLRPQSIVPKFCSVAPTSTAFAYSGRDALNQVAPVEPSSTMNFDLTVGGPKVNPPTRSNPDLNKSWTDKTFYCGNRFFVKDGGTQACFGDVCGAGNFCADLNYPGKNANQTYTCVKGTIGGSITGDAGGLGGQILNSNVFQGNIKLIALCKDPSKSPLQQQVEAINMDILKPQLYTITVDGNLENSCGGKANLAGFYLGVEVADQTGGVGKIVENAPTSWGLADWYAVGQQGPNSHICDVNLSSLIYNRVANRPPDCSSQKDADSLVCTCANLSMPFNAFIGANDESFRSHLISLEELKNGYQCNININRSDFPAADNGARLLSSSEFLTSISAGAAAGGAAGAVIGLGGASMIFGPIGAGAGAVTGYVTAQTATFYNLFDDPTSCFEKTNTGNPQSNSFKGK